MFGFDVGNEPGGTEGASVVVGAGASVVVGVAAGAFVDDAGALVVVVVVVVELGCVVDDSAALLNRETSNGSREDRLIFVGSSISNTLSLAKLPTTKR